MKVAIAGYGIVGKRRAQCLAQMEGVEIVAVSDADPNAFTGIEEFETVNDYRLLLDFDIDAAVICLPNSLNSTVSETFIRNNISVFCEKPPARSAEELRKVEIALKEAGEQPRLMYGFNHRYHYSVQHAKRLVENRSFGKILYLRGNYGKSNIITFDQTDWRTKLEVAGGGVLIDQGIHMLDLFRHFAGEFQVISAIRSNKMWGYDVEDNLMAILTSDHGVIASIHSSATQWEHAFELEIGLEFGVLGLKGLLTSSKSYGSETLTVTRRGGPDDTTTPKTEKYVYDRDPSWQLEMVAFREFVKEGLAPENGTLSDALKIMELVDKIYSF